MVVQRKTTLSADVLSLFIESHAAVRKRECGFARAILFVRLHGRTVLLHCKLLKRDRSQTARTLRNGV